MMTSSLRLENLRGRKLTTLKMSRGRRSGYPKERRPAVATRRLAPRDTQPVPERGRAVLYTTRLVDAAGLRRRRLDRAAFGPTTEDAVVAAMCLMAPSDQEKRTRTEHEGNVLDTSNRVATEGAWALSSARNRKPEKVLKLSEEIQRRAGMRKFSYNVCTIRGRETAPKLV